MNLNLTLQARAREEKCSRTSASDSHVDGDFLNKYERALQVNFDWYGFSKMS